MCSDIIRWCAVSVLIFTVSCTSSRQLARISRTETDVDVSIPPFVEEEDVPEILKEEETPENDGGPLIMNAVKDLETGEMVATDVIGASKVVARFRNVAERSGKVTVEFDVSVPSSLVASKWQLRLFPEVSMPDGSFRLDPILVTGSKYRTRQIRGYERYREFIASIIRDSSVFVQLRPLEIFLERNYPDIYAMKNDTSFVSDPQAANIFGVTQEEVLSHYTRHGLALRNRRKEIRSEMMLEKLTGGLKGRIRLDTVIVSGTDIHYRYVQMIECRPGVKKIPVKLAGGLYEDGRLIYEIPGKNGIDFYVSSLSSLVDSSPHYRSVIVERNVYDYTNAILDFRQGSADLDTTSGPNAAELSRIRKNMEGMLGMSEYVMDSVVVSASCSMEGSYRYNASLALRRAETVIGLLEKGTDKGHEEIFRKAAVPENWEMFLTVISHDPSVSRESRDRILELPYRECPDSSETVLQSLPEYRYFREKVYPRLRTVRLGFHMHRKDMVKDTVYTSEIDTAYMAGVEALKNLEYPKAVELLGKYRDYNAALAYLSAGYDSKALEIICTLGHYSARVLYLKAVALSRLGRDGEAEAVYGKCVELDPALLHRGRLDPEIQKFTFKYDKL